MALSDILQAMEAAADTEAAGLREAARAEADRLLASARADAEAARARSRAEAVAVLAAERARLEAEAGLERAAARSAAREALVAEVFAEAARSLAGIRAAADYPGILRTLLLEAMADFPPEAPLVVRADPRDLPLLSAIALETGRRLSLEPRPVEWGGLIVEGESGRVLADNTLLLRLERARQDLWPTLAADLLAPVEPPAVAGAGRHPGPPGARDRGAARTDRVAYVPETAAAPAVTAGKG
jgi:vacuolar-type H+-ATPase subunit E/Vma4